MTRAGANTQWNAHLRLVVVDLMLFKTTEPDKLLAKSPGLPTIALFFNLPVEERRWRSQTVKRWDTNVMAPMN